MPRPISCGNTAVELKPSPINPAWIRAGEPVARNAVLSSSDDRSAYTLIWACTPGRFVWHYDTEETIHILEGSVVLDDGAAGPRRLGPGDVVFFPAGAVVDWTVESPVRKLAFFRRRLPAPLGVFARVAFRVKDILRAWLAPAPASAAAAAPLPASPQAGPLPAAA